MKCLYIYKQSGMCSFPCGCLPIHYDKRVDHQPGSSRIESQPWFLQSHRGRQQLGVESEANSNAMNDTKFKCCPTITNDLARFYMISSLTVVLSHFLSLSLLSTYNDFALSVFGFLIPLNVFDQMLEPKFMSLIGFWFRWMNVFF